MMAAVSSCWVLMAASKLIEVNVVVIVIMLCGRVWVQILIPRKLMKAMPMSPVMMNVIPTPRRGFGICE